MPTAIRIGLILLLSLIFKLELNAQTTYSFAGKIDKFPIYMEVSIDGNSISGAYFYKNQLVNIPLTGRFQGKTLYLTNDFEVGEAEEKIEVFKLNWNTKSCTGSWIKNKKTLKVNLNPIPAAELNPAKINTNPFLKASEYSALNRVKIGLFKLTKIDSILQVDGRTLCFFKETHSQIQLFRVDNGYSPDELTGINAFLEFKHISHYLGYLECKSYSMYEVYYEFSYEDINFSKEWFTFATIGSYYCGGAHPDEYMEAVNYHIPSKKNFELEDIIQDIPTSDETLNNSTFTKQVIAYFERTHPEYFDRSVSNENSDSENMDDECEYNRPELYTVSISGVATKDGFVLFPYFEHYRGFCNWPSWCVVPYTELANLIPASKQSIMKW